MLRELIFIFNLLITALNFKFDSFLNTYKNIEYYESSYNDITNSTWKEIVVADKLINLVKCVPAKIDYDKELDLIVLDSETRLYWVSNIRGTSSQFNHQFISKSKLLDFLLHGDSNDPDNFFILGLNSSGKKILKFNSSINKLNNSLLWTETVLFDLDDSTNYGISLIDPTIKSINLYPVSAKKQYLFFTVTDFLGYNNIVKISLTNQNIENFSMISVNSKVNLIGGFDINMDGLVDILYVDGYSNVS